MPFTSGDTLGPYEILAPLGAGGMGEVYRARDTRLGRNVALKILPAALANDADYIARFQREAQMLASLNHTNIAAIYGLEGDAIVMELVEGETPRHTPRATPWSRRWAYGIDTHIEYGASVTVFPPTSVTTAAASP